MARAIGGSYLGGVGDLVSIGSRGLGELASIGIGFRI